MWIERKVPHNFLLLFVFHVYVLCAFSGISVKVYVVDLASETISFPVTVRAALSQTVGELRELIGGELGVSADGLRCVLEMHSDLKQLLDPGRLLKVEGFTKSNKVVVNDIGDVSVLGFLYMFINLSTSMY